ncbi:armadillo-type protein [Chytriomyces sp. MP71]|nr:armadillo-type protein [Chytriomyces sp. MP71]
MDKRKDGQVVQLFWAIGQFCKGNLVDQMESAAAELTSALSTIQSPISTNAQRQRAHETIEAAKQRPSECATLGVALILRTESCLEAGNSKFLALSLLQHVLRFHWDTISKQEKETLKDAMVAWVAGPESSLNHAPRFLVEKSCAVLAQIAERMWPVNWRQFDDFLKTLFYKDIHSQERALLVFKCLVEDTFLFENSIAELRKKDLSISLIAITVDAPVLNKVYCSGDRALASSVSSGLNVDYVLNMIRADPGNEGWLLRLSKNLIRLKQSDQNANPNIKHLIRLSLETIAAILNWIILEGIESSNILALLFELLISPSFEERMDATECLITLLSRSSLVSEEHCWRVILDPIFDSPFLLAGIRTAVAGVYGLGPDAWGVTLDQATQRIAVIETERHEYLKKLAELIAVFGEHQVFYKHMTQKPPNFGSFLELVVYFTCHPSRSISLAVAPIWSDMATHEVYKHAPELSNYKVRLIDCSVARITQMHSLPPGPGGPFSPETVRAYDEVEFLEEGEKAACIDALRQRCMELVKFLMVDYAAVVVATVEGYTRALAFTPQEDARNASLRAERCLWST